MADTDDAVTFGKLPEYGRDSKSYLDQLAEAVKRAQEYLSILEAATKKSDAAHETIAQNLTKAAEAQARADNEALRANQAKNYVEEHSNTAAKLKAQMESDAATIAQKRAEIEAVGQGFANLRASSEADMTAIAGTRKSADEAAKAVAEVFGKAGVVQASITESKKEIDVLSQSVRDESKNIKADVAQVIAAKDNSAAQLLAIQKTNTTITELQERSKTAHAAIDSFEKGAKAKLDSVSDLVTKSQDLEKKVEAYETTLAQLQAEYSALKDKVENLLPSATSAGLASAFLRQRKHFEQEREKWAKILFGSLVLLMAVVLYLGFKFEANADDWQAVARHLLQRLPYMVPPVWMAVYAGRQHTLATRMEEEYATKEAISASFEGYKREMASDPEAAKALASNVLAILARHPGTVYEGNHHDVTAFTPAVDAAQNLLREGVDAVAAQIKSALPGLKK